jgi:hypothetical protein
MSLKKKATVWVIMHYEFMLEGKLDCMQFHVSSSLKQAEAYVKKSGVMPYSWWQVHRYVVDEHGDDAEVYYYSYRGKPLKNAPWNQARRAFDAAKARGEL